MSFVCAPQPVAGQTADAWLEELSDHFLACGALSVSIEDADAHHADRERPMFGEPGADLSLRAWPSSRVQLLLADTQDPQDWWAAHAPLEAMGPPDISRLTDDDWVAKTQAQFDPLEVLDTLWVGPSWHPVPVAFTIPPRIALTIDPGMAFGTGGHATTQLCLEAILQAHAQKQLPASARVLDYGCGSGILALAAAACGVERVLAVDIDPVAVDVASANARNNALADRVRCMAAQDDLSTAGDVPSTGYDLVVANILAQPLKLLAPLLWRLTAPQGGLVLSGLLDSQAEAMIDWYASVDPQRPPLAVLGQRDGWACIGRMPRVFDV